jgi:Fe-S-cluster containining protein
MIEPSQINVVAKKYENENVRFRTFLKCHADCDELDRQFLELHNELFAEYDCAKCRNCCQAFSTGLTESEIDNISAFLGSSKEDFIEKHLVQSIEGYEIKAPCCFLKSDGVCQIQECRPESCSEFPHTNKPERLWSLLGILSFAEVCPVVFEILQRLKKIYRFKTRR